MNYKCGFCNKDMAKIEHTNKDLFDIFFCEGCRPGNITRYRHVLYTGRPGILATTVRIDEYFVVINYAFNYTTRRTNFTKVYKHILGELNDDLDLEPLQWTPNVPVFDIDHIIRLPLPDVEACKRKLAIYTTFS